MAEISPCFTFHYYYEGPDPSHDTSPFTIHCTFEKGVEAYYSGIRVVVIAKKTGYDETFAKAEIRPRRSSSRLTTSVIGSLVAESLEVVEESVDDHGPSEDGLPVYALIFELVDVSCETWSGASIEFQSAVETSKTKPVQIPETHRVLYKYEKNTIAHSLSCNLLLATRNAGLRRRLKPDNPSGLDCVYPAPMGPPTHGFRVLPPSEKRSLFTQPPVDVLYNIFSNLALDASYYENWRKDLVSMSLVCRAWWKTALCIVYEDFETYADKKPDIGKFATALKGSPMWGRYIKRFSPYCFTAGGLGAKFNEDALIILKTASNMRTLTVVEVDPALAEQFVEAFCTMTELRNFTQLSSLNAAQLAKCFSHWPKLRRATVYQIGRPTDEDRNDELAPAKCALDELKLERGLISMIQLRNITASSRETLHTVVLKSIRGISNKEIASWLLDFGPTLTNLTLQSNVFTRSEEEELALDQTISQMPKLFDLTIDGPIATVLTLLRFEPITDADQNVFRRRCCLRISDPMLIDPHAFVIALRTTKWNNVNITGLRMSEENSELAEEAKKVASERRIFLFMG